MIELVWRLVPGWLKGALAALLAIGAAFLAGRSKGLASAKQAQAAQRTKSLEVRKEVTDEVLARPADDLDSDLNEWMRDKRR